MLAIDALLVADNGALFFLHEDNLFWLKLSDQTPRDFRQ
jgi:hypothetical protein